MPPYNGSGTFTPYVPGNPVIPGTVISATAFNATQTDIAAGLTNSVTRDGQSPPTANLPMGGRKHTGLGAGVIAGDSLRWEQLFSQGTEQDIASAATVDVGALNTTITRITGTTTITSFGTNYNGPRFVRFSGALTLTHNASTLILPTGSNITTAAGDAAVFVPKGSPADGWTCVSYMRANGAALAGASAGLITTSGLTMNTSRVLGRTTAGAGAIEEMTGAQVRSFANAVGLTGAETVAGAKVFTDGLRGDGISNAAGTVFTNTATLIQRMPFCRVNFNGVGTLAVRSGYGYSSVTDLGTGQYRVNFSATQANNEYTCSGFAGTPGSGNAWISPGTQNVAYSEISTLINNTTAGDCSVVAVVFHA